MAYTNTINGERSILSMDRIFAWMAGALGLTALTAYAIAMNPYIFSAIFRNPTYFTAILILQVGLVMAISLLVNRISFLTAALLFVVYAASVGVTTSAIFYAFTLGSVFATFIVAAGMFAAMAIYGRITKADLSSIGSIGLMILVGMIIAGIVNLFLRSSTLNLITSMVGVVLFSLLTAYDVQKLKQIAQRSLYDQETADKIAIIGALTLYLDFINLFLSLLQFMGKRRDQ